MSKKFGKIWRSGNNHNRFLSLYKGWINILSESRYNIQIGNKQRSWFVHFRGNNFWRSEFDVALRRIPDEHIANLTNVRYARAPIADQVSFFIKRQDKTLI